MEKINIQFAARINIEKHDEKEYVKFYRPSEQGGEGYILPYGVKINIRRGYSRIYPWHIIEDVEVWENDLPEPETPFPRAEAAKNEPEDKLDAAQDTGKWAMEQLGKTVFGDVER